MPRDRAPSGKWGSDACTRGGLNEVSDVAIPIRQIVVQSCFAVRVGALMSAGVVCQGSCTREEGKAKGDAEQNMRAVERKMDGWASDGTKPRRGGKREVVVQRDGGQIV